MLSASSTPVVAVPRLAARSNRTEWTIMLLLTGLCALLPTQNSTPDAWYYAACVRHGHELFQPHHLLYNAVGWLWVHLLPGAPDTLAALKLLNALAFGGCLLVLRSLLHRLGGPLTSAAGWLLVVGGSFGMLRFATENETYLLPLLFSLLASRSWWRATTEGGRRRWLSAGAWATGAALLHQIHAGWALALLAGILANNTSCRYRNALWYALPALAIPLLYAAALPTWNQPYTLSAFWRFVFHDLYGGHAGAPPSGRTLLLTGISFLRTFGQLHGSTLALLQRWPALVGLTLLSGGLMLRGVYQAWRMRQNIATASPAPPFTAPQSAPDSMPARARRHFWRTHAWVLLLQVACAIWAEGNAEFMVMVPSLLALLLVRCPAIRPALPWAGAALLLWNLTFGLLPAYALRLTHSAPLLTRIQQQPAAWWLLTDPNLILNQLHYRTGQPVGPINVLPAPALWVQRPGQSRARFRAWLESRHVAQQTVYTDALGGPRLLDRARLTQGGDEVHRALLTNHRLTRQDSFPTSFGPVYLTEIQ